MSVNRVPSFVPSLIELIEASRRSILLAPVNLGGASGSSGGTGSPPGGFLGQLAQINVAYDTTETGTLSGSTSLLDNLNHLRARASTSRKLYNLSGVSLIAGTVVVIHTSADNSFETTTTASDVDVLGVLQQLTLSGSLGIVMFNGYSPAVRVSGSVNRGDYLYHSGTAGLAQAGASGSLIGCFGRALTADTASLVAAVIWHPNQGGSGGGGGSGDVATDLIWDAKGDLAAGTGANTAQRLASGSSGQVLTVDAATSTGLKWATPAAGGGSLSGSGTATNVALWSGASTLTEDPLLNYDPGNTRLVLGRSSAMASFGARLQVYRDGGQAGVTVISSGSSPFFGAAYHGGSFASPVAVNSGEIIFDISANAWAATINNFISPPPMRLVAYTAEAWNSAVGYGNYWEFVTTPVGSTTRIGAVRMHAFGIGLRESSAPTTPPTNWGSLYAKTDGILYWKNDAGSEYDLTASGSGGAASLLSNTAWNAKGDLLAGTADDTAIILASGSNGQVLTVDTTQTTGLKWATPSAGGGSSQPGVMQARLTLTTAVPVTVSNVTAATTIYLTPFRGNRVTLYVSAVWTEYTLTERSASLSGLTANTNYDVFLYDNAGTLTLDLVAWTNATTRATALALVDGVSVKSGANERLYVGTLRITSTTGQCEDGTSRRYVWNAYNRMQRNLLVTETTDTWNYAVTAWRAANGNAANKVEYVCGLSEDLVVSSVLGQGSVGAGIAGSVGVGVDTDSANSAQLLIELVGTQNVANGGADYFGYPGLGYHYLQWIEYRRAGTIAFYGDAGIGDSAFQAGLMAVVTG